MGAYHAATLKGLDDVTEVVVSDTDQRRAVSVGAELGARVESDVGAVFATCPDAVVLAATTVENLPLLRTCVRAGIPVFCEKPVTLDVAEAFRLVSDVRATDAVVQVGFQRRFDLAYRYARQAIEAGEVGRIHSIRMVSCDAEPPPRSYLPFSGGIFKDLQIHDFDLIRWLTGREVRDVHATGVGWEPEEDIFTPSGDFGDIATVLTLEDNTLVTLIGGRRGAGYDSRLEVSGSRGALSVGRDEWRPVPGVRGRVARTRTDRHAGFLERFADAYQAELRAFVGLVCGRQANACPVDAALDALLIAEAAGRSALEHRTVRVNSGAATSRPV